MSAAGFASQATLASTELVGLSAQATVTVAGNPVSSSIDESLDSATLGGAVAAASGISLAELTVQQGVLIYGYGVYYVAKQKRIKKKQEMADQGSDGVCAAHALCCRLGVSLRPRLTLSTDCTGHRVGNLRCDVGAIAMQF